VEPLAATVSVDGVLCLFDLRERRMIGRWSGFRMATNDGVRFDPSGTRLLLPAADSSFRVLEVPSGRVALTLPVGGPGEALGVAWSPDGTRIAVSTRQPAMRLYDAASGSLIREFDAPPSAPWTVIFSPDGRHVLSGSWDRSIGVWNVETGRLERRLEGHRGLVTALAFRPREPNILASAGADGRLMLWDLSLPQETPVLVLDSLDGWEIWALDFDRTGRHITATNSPGQTAIWDLRHFNRHMGGNMLSQIRLHRDTLGPSFDEAAALEQRRLLLNRGRPEGAPADSRTSASGP
ncbi:MAG: PD40 domain-containing protein, partial [Phycisphaerae bacterium]|nr:PD40 domain-containing protein [Phycisphaerae bacterium]